MEFMRVLFEITKIAMQILIKRLSAESPQHNQKWVGLYQNKIFDNQIYKKTFKSFESSRFTLSDAKNRMEEIRALADYCEKITK